MTDVARATTDEPEGVDDLAGSLAGRLLRPEDDGYDAARQMWNAMFDRRPPLIAQCASIGDVTAALAFARSHDLPVTVRGAGHSFSGKSTSDEGIVIDLGPMKGVEVDPGAKVARVAPGAVGAELDQATQAHGLATTGGTYSTTGVIGLTLGGGMGFLARRYGLAVDNMLSADVVLADGRQVHASESEHPDLFWALRGGGGNLGIVTSIELRLHEVGREVAVAQVFYPWEVAGDIFRKYRDFVAEAPDEVGGYALAVNVPPIPEFPQEAHGSTAVALVFSHCGPVEEGEAALRPLTEFGTPLFSVLVPMEYATLQQSFDAAVPAHQRYYGKTTYLSGIPDEAIATFVARADPLPGPYSSAYFETMGGAIGRVDPQATAFPHRSAPFNLAIGPGWADPAADDACMAWTRDFAEAMSPYSTGGIYANYADRDDVHRLRATYGPNLERLVEIKARYDPDQVFSRLSSRD
ncbi:MAG: FAD-binding oxidoreductase [Candidatus Limnocylindria bacterium]